MDIANTHKISPQAIYKILVNKNNVTPVTKLQGSGIGNKTLSQVCEVRGLKLNEAVEKLNRRNLSFSKSDKFKDIATNNHLNPTELLDIIK